MTAVVGLLNKKGIAIAADSAVTRRRDENEKITNNGNKMVRISDDLPISVMFTGSASFNGNLWDVIARRYRTQRKKDNYLPPTVEECMLDFFNFIAQMDILWPDEYTFEWLMECSINIIVSAIREISWELWAQDNKGNFHNSQAFIKDFSKQLTKIKKASLKTGHCLQFENYTLSDFLKSEHIGRLMEEQQIKRMLDKVNVISGKRELPKEFVKAASDEFLATLHAYVSTRIEHQHGCAVLIFSGFGTKERYPSLISVCVCGGIARHVNYHYRPEDIVEISNERPAAICHFAQDDVMLSLMEGVHKDWREKSQKSINEKINKLTNELFPSQTEIGGYEPEFQGTITSIDKKKIIKKFGNSCRRQFDKNKKEWEKLLVDCDLNSMAALAESLIDLTGFQRILTFQQEGVGGTIDVAIASKEGGFVWKNRKSWYHHKDVNGQYGSLGI